MHDNTLKYYKKHADKLIERYDTAKVEQLHKLFRKNIGNDDNVLDIGFGSGRDLRVIKQITPNVYGLDACSEFIDNVLDTDLEDRVARSILPEIDIKKLQVNVKKFDVVVSIAVLMHLSIDDITKTVQNIQSILTDKGMVIVSYSLERENKDTRYFGPITKEIMLDIFNKYNFIEIESFENDDSLNREINWITQVFKVKGEK